MGFPKYKLQKDHQNILEWWHDKSARYCEEVFISGTKLQQKEFPNLPFIEDHNSDNGPLEGIFQAFQRHPKSYWMIMACDLLYAEEHDIAFLRKELDIAYEAIAYYDAEIKSPFPLFSILSPELKQSISESYLFGNKSLRDLLKNARCKAILTENRNMLKSINTPLELDAWKSSHKPDKVNPTETPF